MNLVPEQESDCDNASCDYQEPHRHGFACDKTCSECGGHVDQVPGSVSPRLVHGPFRIDLLVMTERVREAQDETWALVDDVADLRHSIGDDSLDRMSLRVIQERVREAWAALASASTVLQEMTKP